jgi:3-hydroxyisobutyrate dehydrogenase-like beta-hydroxyacid dehydrogenase
MQTVGVVGAGAMGSVMVERFLAAGLQTFVYDVSAPAVQRATALGAVACPSPAEVAAASESVSVMVRTDDQMLDSVLGPHGVLSTLRPGSVLLLHSTIQPSTTRRVGEAAQAQGVEVADACIAGVPSVLRAGTAFCVAGGEAELIQRITPHLLLLVRRVLHMGPLGCGNAAKIMRNLVNLTDQLILFEGMQLTEAAGVSREALLEMLALIYASRLGADGDVHIDPSRPAGNLFDTILPLARQLADDLGQAAPLTRYLAASDPPLA